MNPKKIKRHGDSHHQMADYVGHTKVPKRKMVPLIGLIGMILMRVLSQLHIIIKIWKPKK